MSFRMTLGGMACVATLAATIARADIDPNSGIDFVRIRAVGNAPWPGDGTLGDRAIGRGGVNYEYSIGKFEVTTAQWVEFFNAAMDRPSNDRLPHVFPPSRWGAQPTVPISGGQRWTVPAGNEMLPTGNISWRMAAMYCNWLHNDKQLNREAFLDGAYDVSTFGFTGAVMTDQRSHHPSAKYWIPTWDEWLKAAHYDPHKNGPDQGGWWKYSITSDTVPISGPPQSLAPDSLGQVNAGGWISQYPNLSSYAIPLGAYAGVTSPWGLFDTGGATTEWTESIIQSPGGPPFRILDGSNWFDGNPIADAIWTENANDFPNVSTFDFGFRIASSIPPPTSIVLLVFAGAFNSHRRRSATNDSSDCDTRALVVPRRSCECSVHSRHRC